MIILVQGADKFRYNRLITEMFRLRASVFDERLGWDVNVVDGMEMDQFDRVNPLYLLSVNDNGTLRGSLRLLPTTGPNMLRDVFPELMDGSEPVCSPIIWESTRFCVSSEAASERTANRLNYTTAELLAGIVEVGQLAGLDWVASVYDARMKRVLRNAGCPAVETGTPTRIGKVMTYAGLFAIDDEMLGRIKEAAGIEGSVLEQNSAEMLMAA